MKLYDFVDVNNDAFVPSNLNEDEQSHNIFRNIHIYNTHAKSMLCLNTVI